MAAKFNTVLQVPTKHIGSLIGRGGSNAKRLTKSVGHSAYIKAFNTQTPGSTLIEQVKASRGRADAFYIQASTREAVLQLRKMLLQDLAALEDPSKKSTRPSTVVSVKPEAVGTIIGRRGSSLRHIQSIAGDNCYIVHRQEAGGFVVTADTLSAVKRAKQKILDAERKYNRDQQAYKKAPRKHTNVSTQQGRFVGLDFSSDESDDDVDSAAAKPAINLGFRVRGNIASRRSDNSYRWKVAHQMAEERNCEVGDISWPEVEQEIRFRNQKKQFRPRRERFPSQHDFQPLGQASSYETSWTKEGAAAVANSDGVDSLNQTRSTVQPVNVAPALRRQTYQEIQPITIDVDEEHLSAVGSAELATGKSELRNVVLTVSDKKPEPKCWADYESSDDEDEE